MNDDGFGRGGNIGDGTMLNRWTPTAVSGLNSGVTMVSFGIHHTCAIVGSSAALKCWGYNEYGAIGDGTNTNRLTPVAVSQLTSGVVMVSAGQHHTCAIDGSSGGLFCWGSNQFGELGDNSNTNRNTPTAVHGLNTGVSTVSAGSSHTCAVTSSGALWCWGYNNFAKLGDGTETNRYTPVAVIGLTSNVQAVSVGGHSSCAIVGSSRVLWCWGFFPLVGCSGTVCQPTQKSKLSSGIVMVSVGDHKACVITEPSHSLVCWDHLNNPQPPAGLSTDISMVHVDGLTHICAVKNTVTSPSNLWCWGMNSKGQIGDDSTTNRDFPVNIVIPIQQPVSAQLSNMKLISAAATAPTTTAPPQTISAP
jgi:alpha-tubulin suppressor-like RCC1 family protein